MVPDDAEGGAEAGPRAALTRRSLLRGAAATAAVVLGGGVAAAAALNGRTDPASGDVEVTPGTARVGLRTIAVTDFGALGGRDDATTINAAIAAANGCRLVFPRKAKLNTSGSVIAGASDVVVDGNGATLVLARAGPAARGIVTRVSGIDVQGTCRNLEIRNLGVRGNGSVTDPLAGITGGSDAWLDDIRIVDCDVRDVTLGISFSANSEGSLTRLLLQGNHVQNVVGTESGYGYGLHWATSDTVTVAAVRCIGNTVRSAQRHAIYCAQVRGATIADNTVLDHRDVIRDDAIRSAVMLARSADVVATRNIVDRSAGGALHVAGPDAGTLAGPYTVVDNVLTRPQDEAGLVYIGQLDPEEDGGVPVGVDFRANELTAGRSHRLMTVYNGMRLRIVGNTFRMPDGENTALALSGVGVQGHDYFDDVEVVDNLFDVGANDVVRLSGSEGLTTAMRFVRNRAPGAPRMFTVSERVTNPNITVRQQSVAGLDR